MASVGDTLPHCTGTGTQSDPYIFSDDQGFVEAVAVSGSYITASTNGIEMNADNGIIPVPLYFNGNTIDGKGATIFNQTLNATTGDIIQCNGAAKITGMNFYNMILMPSNNSVKFINAISGGSYHITVNFINCNFTGIVRGTVGSNNFIATRINNSNWTCKYNFTSCTFNFNFSLTATANINLFATNSYDGIQLTKCTLSLTGKINNNSYSLTCGTTYVKFNGCSFLSNQNWLSVSGTFSIAPTNDGYNYFRMSVTANTVTISNAKTLVNRSYITATTMNLSSSISMQQDDSSATDYIFDEDNLETVGFPIAEVIT